MATPSLAVRIYPETLRSLAFGSISGTYTGIGTGLNNPCRILNIVNNTNGLLTFSFDGVNDHFVLPANAFLLLDVTSNMTLVGGTLVIAQGQRIYVKGTPSSGSVYLSSFYGAGS